MEAVLEKPKSKQKKNKAKENTQNVEIPSTRQEEPVASTSSFSDADRELAPADHHVPVVPPLETKELDLADVIDKLIMEDQERNREEEIAYVSVEAVQTSTESSAVPKSEQEDRENSNSIAKLLQTNMEIVNSLKLSELELENNVQTTKEDISSKMLDVKAYTESQLAPLYSNPELVTVSQFVTDFVEAELRGIFVKNHKLFELLGANLKACTELTGNSLELEQLQQEYKEIRNRSWSLDAATVTGSRQCHDEVTVSATHSYTKAVFHRHVFQEIERILTSLWKLITETRVLYSYFIEITGLKIDLYLQTLVTNCINVSQLQRDSPISLIIDEVSPQVSPVLGDLRLCISVLFAFQRRLIKETEFIKRSRDWLSRLVAILLRIGNWQDHLFILNHVLRCPAGVGSWAAEFIQMPLTGKLEDSPFSSYQINHVIAVLAVMLMPIQKREEFLEQLAQSQENPDDALWVIVDSEGEEDVESSGTALRENDLVQLLNQLPLADVFRATMLIQRRDGQDYYNSSQITENHILRFLAFCTTLLKIVQQGLTTYNQLRYLQFTKRLCRFMQHIVQFVTDLWEQSKNDMQGNDPAMFMRLQVEYDAFFLRATGYLYAAQKTGAWQFLAVIPYHVVSTNTLWRICYMLQSNDASIEALLDPTVSTDFRRKLNDESVHSQFEEKISSYNDDECYFLLNAFANMVLARNEDDMDFIVTVTLELLQIGFISEATQESCSKTARILLTYITSKYPFLITHILKCIKAKFTEIGSLSLYLFEQIPLSVWQPTDVDMEIIASWLMQNYISTDESRLARMILSRLNWGFTAEGCLFLPYKLHFKTALLLAQVVEQEAAYLPWAWQTAYRLRLHVTDKGFSDLTRIAEMDDINVVSKGVREHKPFSCFLGLLMTSWGHLIPLVCTKGLALLENLQFHQKYDAIVFSLQLVVPLFLDCIEPLINCEKFQNILVCLLNADRTYINMARSFVAPQNPVLEQFGNMIQYQIENYSWYNLKSPICLVRLWMNSLVSVPTWNNDQNVLYLLDIIFKSTFGHSDALDVAINIIRQLLQNATPQEHNSSISSLFKWASQSTLPQGSLLNATSLPSCVWLAYILIALEHEEREEKTGLWTEILTQLKTQTGKVNVDAAIKKAASVVKVPYFSSASLCIYRWAQQALDTPIGHPLLPLLWQKFFSLYLVRISVESVAEKGCLGEKFFDGVINLGFLKRLKRQIQQTMNFYQKKAESCYYGQDDEEKLFYEHCCRLFRTYSLWLEEPRVQEASLYVPSLPRQYQPDLLDLIIQGSTEPWLQYLDYETVKFEKQKSIKTWRTSIYREKTNVNLPVINPGSGVESADPVERILRRLGSYDSPKPPPALVQVTPVIPDINLTEEISVLDIIENHFKTLQQFAHDHNMRVSEHKDLDSTYKELVPQLYRSVLYKVKKQVVCRGSGQKACAGAALITLNMQEARINERIDHDIQTNRNDYESMLKKSIKAPSQSLSVSCVTIEKVIETLEMQLRSNPASFEMGVELFYHILSLLNEETSSYPPTNQFYRSCLEKLGQIFILGDEYEAERLLNKILKEPTMVDLLVPYFSPVNAGRTNFLHMYSTICNDIGQRCDVIHSLISKFDVHNWLTVKEPKISQRKEFIELTLQVLTMLDFDPSPVASPLHTVCRKHLIIMFEYQFPEHYGDVLIALLKASGGRPEIGSVATNVWVDIINSLSRPAKLRLNVPPRDQLRAYAQDQHHLNYQELLETALVLAANFRQERLQYGLHGLYPKYRNYIDIFVFLLGMIGHAFIISSLKTHEGVLSDKLCQNIWPHLLGMFAPWVSPYWRENVKTTMVPWMQQLTDDRAVILPWIPGDGILAAKMVCMLFECIQFMTLAFPGSNSILSLVWHWYVRDFAHVTVKEHILNAVHDSFLTLPWHSFWPTVEDLEYMLKVVDQYLPESHIFLGHIFLEVPWTTWVVSVSENASIPVQVKVHQCLLHLLVRLANEPNVRTNSTAEGKAKILLSRAETLNWDIVEQRMYEQIMDWYVLSCDPLVLCQTDPENLDFRVLNFLKVVAHYHKPLEQDIPSLLEKRRFYVCSYVKLMSLFTSKHKSIIPSKINMLTSAINADLKHMEEVVQTEEELKIILTKMFGLLNIDGIKDVAVKCFEQWILVKSTDSIVLNGVFQTLAFSVTNTNFVATLYEKAIYSYFFNSSESSVISWKNLGRSVKPYPPRLAELQQVLVAQGNLLTLHALLVQQVATCTDSLNLLNTIIQWLTDIKVSPTVEDKLPLFWSQFLYLALLHCDIDEHSAGSTLYKFSQLLLQISKEGISLWKKGLLGVMGVVKQDPVSLNFRFLCRAVGGYVLAQLPDMKGAPQIVRFTPNAPAAVGKPGGNTECTEYLLKLDFGQSQGEIKALAELALQQIQDSSNSLHNSRDFLSLLVTKLYTKPYLRDIGDH